MINRMGLLMPITVKVGSNTLRSHWRNSNWSIHPEGECPNSPSGICSKNFVINSFLKLVPGHTIIGLTYIPAALAQYKVVIICLDELPRAYTFGAPASHMTSVVSVL